jgi:uncharacterized protein YecE (DUF72 family)
MRGEREAEQSHLSFYADRFSCVEINTSFYRPHRAATYARWRLETPTTFRFSVKMPRAITHESGLRRTAQEVASFYDDMLELQPKLGAVLVQLPPSLEYSAAVVRSFFEATPRVRGVAVTCEPRHVSWFSPAADEALRRLEVSRVAADPGRHERSDTPGGARRFAYFRWHGTPRMYYSKYSTTQLVAFADKVRCADAKDTWCIFDNTAAYAAWDDALRFIEILRNPGRLVASGEIITVLAPGSHVGERRVVRSRRQR